MPKKFFTRGLAAFALLVGLAFGLTANPSVSYAQTAPTSTVTNPNTPTTSCGTVACPGTTVWDIKAAGVFTGMGAGVFGGTTNGKVDITKKGGTDLDLQMNGTGCADLNCANGASGFIFKGRTFEKVGVDVIASGGAKDVPVFVENGGAAGVGMRLQIQRLQGPPASGHTQN